METVELIIICIKLALFASIFIIPLLGAIIADDKFPTRRGKKGKAIFYSAGIIASLAFAFPIYYLVTWATSYLASLTINQDEESVVSFFSTFVISVSQLLGSIVLTVILVNLLSFALQLALGFYLSRRSA